MMRYQGSKERGSPDFGNLIKRRMRRQFKLSEPNKVYSNGDRTAAVP